MFRVFRFDVPTWTALSLAVASLAHGEPSGSFPIPSTQLKIVAPIAPASFTEPRAAKAVPAANKIPVAIVPPAPTSATDAAVANAEIRSHHTIQLTSHTVDALPVQQISAGTNNPAPPYPNELTPVEIHSVQVPDFLPATSCHCDGCLPCESCCDSEGGFDESCKSGGCWFSKDLAERWRLIDALPGHTDCEGNTSHCFEIGGWTSFGYHSRDNGLFNNRPDKFNLHQMWLYAERVADGSEGFDWGFRADIMYGQDAGDTQAFGNNPGQWDYLNGWDHGAGYGWAMPQLYAEAAFGDFSIKFGHFYTLLGYEVVPAPDNFFYSHAYTMYNSEAFTHTGFLATQALTENVTLYGGYTAGWDTGFDQYSRNGEQGRSFLGGYSVDFGENITFTHIVTAGDLGLNGDGWSQSLVADIALTEKLNYVFQSDIFDAENIETVGINQYLLYALSDRLGLGTRVEWWKADGSSVGAWTAGLNVKPCANVTLRPELRYQWDPGADNGVLATDSAGEFIAGVDCVVTF